MRVIAIILGAILLAATAGAVVRRHPYRHDYVKHTFGPRGLAGVGARAAIPHGSGGFGHRLATGAAGHVVNNSLKYSVGGLRHEDLKYHRSANRHFGARLKHALASTVVTHKTTSGKKTVAAGNMAGAAGSAAIGGAATGGLSVAATAGGNVAREFWPRKKHHAARRVRY